MNTKDSEAKFWKIVRAARIFSWILILCWPLSGLTFTLGFKNFFDQMPSMSVGVVFLLTYMGIGTLMTNITPNNDT